MKRFIQRKIFRFKMFFSRIKRLLKWRKTIWESEDWDFTFLLIMMHKKLESMEKLHRYNGHAENSEQVANEIKQMKEDIKTLIELDDGELWNGNGAEKAKKVFSEEIANKILGWWD